MRPFRAPSTPEHANRACSGDPGPRESGRPDPSLRKRGLLGMTIKLTHYPCATHLPRTGRAFYNRAGMTARTPVTQPKASRPLMKGYGVPKSLKGALPWEWARQRLVESHNHFIVSVRPNGAPHLMPVWGVWREEAFYFSTAETSRKARNLKRNPNCVVSTEKAEEAVIVEGVAR